MISRISLSLAFVSLLLLSNSSAMKRASAEIYQFTSPDGTVHFTNVPTDPRYRRMTEKSPSQARKVRADVHAAILAEARNHKLDPALIKAVIKVESDFDPYAVSSAGALGLMQLMPATMATLAVRNPFNIQENIAGGVRHLRDLLDRFGGDLTLALAGYHAGAERVMRYGGVPPIDQTRHYIRKVLAAYESYLGREAETLQTFRVTELK
jgi:soluble lytic murein transglycosylase-like protein